LVVMHSGTLSSISRYIYEVDFVVVLLGKWKMVCFTL